MQDFCPDFVLVLWNQLIAKEKQTLPKEQKAMCHRQKGSLQIGAGLHL